MHRSTRRNRQMMERHRAISDKVNTTSQILAMDVASRQAGRKLHSTDKANMDSCQEDLKCVIRVMLVILARCGILATRVMDSRRDMASQTTKIHGIHDMLTQVRLPLCPPSPPEIGSQSQVLRNQGSLVAAPSERNLLTHLAYTEAHHSTTSMVDVSIADCPFHAVPGLMPSCISYLPTWTGGARLHTFIERATVFPRPAFWTATRRPSSQDAVSPLFQGVSSLCDSVPHGCRGNSGCSVAFLHFLVTKPPMSMVFQVITSILTHSNRVAWTLR